MARIPIYQSTAPVGRFGPVPQVPTIDVAGPALDALTQGFNAGAGIARQQVENDAIAWSALSTAQANQEWTKQFLDRQQKAEPGAPGFTTSLMNDYDAWVKQKLAEAPNDEAALAFQVRADNIKTGLYQDSTVFERKAHSDMIVSQADGAVQLNANTLLTAPGKFDQVMAETGSAITSLDLSPIDKAAMLKSAEGTLASAAVYGGIEADPHGTLQALKAGTWDGYLTPEGKLSAMNRADAEIKRRQAEARAATAAAQAEYVAGFQDEVAYLSAGGQLPGPSRYTRDSLVKALGADRGGKLADVYEMAATTGQITRDIATMPQDELVGMVTRMQTELLTTGAEDYRARAAQFQTVLGAARNKLGALADDQQDLAAAIKAEDDQQAASQKELAESLKGEDEAYLTALQSEVDFLAGGGSVEKTQFTRQSLVSRFGDDVGGQLADHYEWVRDTAARSGAILTASGADAKATVDQAQADILGDPQKMAAKQAEYDTLKTAFDARTKALSADPAGYAITTNTMVRGAYNDMVTAMADPTADVAGATNRYAVLIGAEIERLTGQPAGAILPKAYVDHVALQFSAQTEGGENAAQMVQGLQSQWGKRWPVVYGQLVQQGALPPEAVVIGSGVAPATANRLAEASRLGTDELKKGFQKSDLTGLGDNIATEMADFRTILTNYPGGDAAFGPYYDAAEKLALSYMRQGASSGEAATRAYQELIGSRYDLRGTYFVPREEDPDEVVPGGAAAVQSDLSAYASRLDLPRNIAGVTEEETREQYRSTLESNGFWITAPDQTGLVLMDPTGAAATIDGGKLLLVPWQQLRDLGSTNPFVMPRQFRDLGAR